MFFVWTGIITIGFVYVAWCNNRNFVESQERIIAAHEALQKVWLEAADVQTREDTRNLLEMEFSKIQHEY